MANIANVLTGVRLVLVPVFLVVLFVGDGHETFWRIAAFIVFAVAVITGVTTVGSTLSTVFANVNTKLAAIPTA